LSYLRNTDRDIAIYNHKYGYLSHLMCCLSRSISAWQGCFIGTEEKKIIERERERERKRRNTSLRDGWGDYPVGGLSPFLLGWHQRLGGHRPAPEHFVVMYGDIGLLRQGPVETGCHQAFVPQRHVADTQAARAGRGGRICWRGAEQKQHGHRERISVHLQTLRVEDKKEPLVLVCDTSRTKASIISGRVHYGPRHLSPLASRHCSWGRGPVRRGVKQLVLRWQSATRCDDRCHVTAVTAFGRTGSSGQGLTNTCSSLWLHTRHSYTPTNVCVYVCVCKDGSEPRWMCCRQHPGAGGEAGPHAKCQTRGTGPVMRKWFTAPTRLALLSSCPLPPETHAMPSNSSPYQLMQYINKQSLLTNCLYKSMAGQNCNQMIWPYDIINSGEIEWLGAHQIHDSSHQSINVLALIGLIGHRLPSLQQNLFPTWCLAVWQPSRELWGVNAWRGFDRVGQHTRAHTYTHTHTPSEHTDPLCIWHKYSGEHGSTSAVCRCSTAKQLYVYGWMYVDVDYIDDQIKMVHTTKTLIHTMYLSRHLTHWRA